MIIALCGFHVKQLATLMSILRYYITQAIDLIEYFKNIAVDTKDPPHDKNTLEKIGLAFALEKMSNLTNDTASKCQNTDNKNKASSNSAP